VAEWESITPYLDPAYAGVVCTAEIKLDGGRAFMRGKFRLPDSLRETGWVVLTSGTPGQGLPAKYQPIDLPQNVYYGLGTARIWNPASGGGQAILVRVIRGAALPQVAMNTLLLSNDFAVYQWDIHFDGFSWPVVNSVPFIPPPEGGVVLGTPVSGVVKRA
jgi:hypothetical protein